MRLAVVREINHENIAGFFIRTQRDCFGDAGRGRGPGPPADAPVKSASPASPSGITGLEPAKRLADGAQIVEGTVAGQGVIANQGTRIIKGKVAPGNSPGCVTDQGNVIFEGSAWLDIELGGTSACTGYDQYNVNLSLTLNAPTLNISLYC